jgi:hypothetical protein
LRSRKFGYWTPSAIIVVGILIGVFVIAEVLLDPLSWLMNVNAVASIREDLAAAEERWQSRGVVGYTIEVEGFVPLVCMINATLTVREGELVAVEQRGVPGGETLEGEWLEPEYWDTPLCSYRELLISEMYARIERELDRTDWSQDRLRVSFDPEYGYVTEYRYGGCYRRGLLNPICSDSSIWYSFSNFEPVTDW